MLVIMRRSDMDDREKEPACSATTGVASHHVDRADAAVIFTPPLSLGVVVFLLAAPFSALVSYKSSDQRLGSLPRSWPSVLACICMHTRICFDRSRMFGAILRACVRGRKLVAVRPHGPPSPWPWICLVTLLTRARGRCESLTPPAAAKP
jgi:hypothetical protein